MATPYSSEGAITDNRGRRRNGKTGFVIESGTAEMNHLIHVFDSQINEWESDPDLEDRGFTHNPEIYADLSDMRYVAGNPFNPRNFETWPKDLRFCWWFPRFTATSTIPATAIRRFRTNSIWAFPTITKWSPTIAAAGRGDPIGIGYGTEHTPVGINTYDNPGLEWHNQGLGCDEFEVEVVRVSNDDGFVNAGEEEATITFTGGDLWALAESSGGVVLDWALLAVSLPVFDSTTY